MTPLSGDVQLTIAPPDEVFKQSYDALAPETLRAIGQRAGAAVGAQGEAFMRQYPPSPAGRPLRKHYTRQRVRDGQPTGDTYKSKFKSARQQAYVFGVLVRLGRIPYVRKGKLGRGIAHTVEVSADGTRITVRWGAGGVPYARYVIGAEQSHYHQETGWQRLDEQLIQHEPQLSTLFRDTYGALASRALG